MFIVFLGFIGIQFAASAFYFFIVWLVMRSRSGVKLGVGSLILGIFATAFVGGLVRFVFWMVSGESVSDSIFHEEALLFFFAVLPIFTAIGICVFFRRQKICLAKKGNSGGNA